MLALAAVKKAIERAGWQDRLFANWGVVASGRSFGRVRFDVAIERYRRMHTRGASPLVVPHLSLHAMSGTLSIALGMHGPNFGVSGQANHLGETLLAGLGMIGCEEVEGLWVVACDLDPEPKPRRAAASRRTRLSAMRQRWRCRTMKESWN